MLSEVKFFTLLTFIIINFLILFVVKTRTTTVTSLIIAHLVAVLFFSISISNHNSFKEITLSLIVYSVIILFLVSNYQAGELGSDLMAKIKASRLHLILVPALLCLVLAIFLALFSITKNIAPIANFIHDKKFNEQNEATLNPMILPSHPIHVAVKKFYFGKKTSDEWLDKSSDNLEISDRKIARLKDKLLDNFLLKRSSDMILIIVAISSSLLLLSQKKTEKNL